jgi:hypothetical protein
MANESDGHGRSSTSPSPSARNGLAAQVSIIELAFRLGVPTFVLVVGLFFLVPRIDRGIQIADRVEGQLNVLAVTCQALASRSD